MTFLEELQSYRGGILRIKSELYWYGGRGWDGTPDRICLVLDAADEVCGPVAVHVCAAHQLGHRYPHGALLLIDGCPQWIWVGPEDVELIT